MSNFQLLVEDNKGGTLKGVSSNPFITRDNQAVQLSADVKDFMTFTDTNVVNIIKNILVGKEVHIINLDKGVSQ